jgi:hypothetical protein
VVTVHATFEILMALFAGLLAGFVVGWVSESYTIGHVACVAVMCFTLDVLFTWEYDPADYELDEEELDGH